MVAVLQTSRGNCFASYTLFLWNERNKAGIWVTEKPNCQLSGGACKSVSSMGVPLRVLAGATREGPTSF